MRDNTPKKDTVYIPESFSHDPYCMVMLKPLYTNEEKPLDFECIDCFPPSDFLTNRYIHMFTGSTHELFLEHCRSVATTGKAFETEAKQREDQADRTYCLRINQLGGNVVVITEDITKHKQKDTQLIHAEDELALLASEKYAQIIQEVPLAFSIVQVVFDEMYEAIDYIFLETNNAFVKQTTLRNAVGKSMMEMEPNHEKEWCRKYGEVIKTRKPLHFIADARHIGNYVYEVWAFPLSKKTGNQVVIFFNDITERVDNQKAIHETIQKYRSLLASLGHNTDEDSLLPATY